MKIRVQTFFFLMRYLYLVPEYFWSPPGPVLAIVMERRSVNGNIADPRAGVHTGTLG